MSAAAEFYARQWASEKTVEEIAAKIDEIKAMPAWEGVELDDCRVRHMRQTEIRTLDAILTQRLAPEGV